MELHNNARSCPASRALLVHRILAGMPVSRAAEAAGISRRTAFKWKGRFREGGEAALLDRSSRPARTRCSVDAGLDARIERLRRARMPVRSIARQVGRSASTISRLLSRKGLSSLSALDGPRVVIRYEREAPGELLHMDTKKLGRIVRPSHRVTGNRRDTVDGAGWVPRVGRRERCRDGDRPAGDRRPAARPGRGRRRRPRRAGATRVGRHR